PCLVASALVVKLANQTLVVSMPLILAPQNRHLPLQSFYKHRHQLNWIPTNRFYSNKDVQIP
ncbi:MAG: hypothetical protein Q8L64_01165, partial [bacterium]|nr:hypothetical protein [bacterium]